MGRPFSGCIRTSIYHISFCGCTFTQAHLHISIYFNVSNEMFMKCLMHIWTFEVVQEAVFQIFVLSCWLFMQLFMILWYLLARCLKAFAIKKKNAAWILNNLKQISDASQAIDHIINSAAKSNYMSAGQISVPIVFRGPNGAAAGVGAQHSQVCFCFCFF